MVKDLVANSPFIDIRFIESGSKLNNLGSEAIFDYYKLDANTPVSYTHLTLPTNHPV